MFKMNYVTKPGDIPEHWRHHAVKMWEEDDALVPDKEKTDDAFERITGSGIRDIVHTVDEGDQFVTFYRRGWIKAINCEGGWVGLLMYEE